MVCAWSWVKEGGVVPLRWGPNTMPLQAMDRRGQWSIAGLGTLMPFMAGVITSMASMGEAFSWQSLSRELAHWIEGRQGAFMAQPRGLGCPLSFCPKLAGHREEREEMGKLGLARVAPVVSRGSGGLCRPCRY
jgi:hypothetical protein